MGIARGPNIVKDGLVFGYDTGYGVADNETTTRFYPGESTTNLFTYPYLSNHTDSTNGTTSIVKEDFGGGLKGVRFIQASTSPILSFAPAVPTTPVSGGTYTWSSYVHSTSTGSKIKSQVSVYVNGVRHWLTNSNTWATSTVECNHLFKPTVANEWHRVDNQITMPTGTLTSFSAGGFYRTASNFTLKVANLQFEQKGHVTPFTATSRSSTESLIDLKRTTNIDVSNVTFGSTGQPEFDGTNDRVVSNAILVEGSQTFETVFMATENPHSPAGILTNHQYTSPQSNFGINYVSNSGNKLGASIGYTDGTREFSSKNTTYVVQQNVAIHAVLAYDQANNRIKWYINGELDSTHNLSKTPNFASIPVCSGRWTAAYNDYYFGGNVYIGKIYDKELTADEVKQNYNAYKNRFNI